MMPTAGGNGWATRSPITEMHGDGNLMGTVLSFGRHADAPADSRGNSASASKVMCSQPRLEASRTMSAQRREGMKPRPRQQLTVGSGTPSASATDFVPPRSLSAESTVIMDGDIICGLQTCQGFADRKMTLSPECGALCAMQRDVKNSQFRAVTTRRFLGFAKQNEFCEEAGIDTSAWNLVENGSRNISLGQARLIKTKFDLSLDWLLDGDLPKLPDHHQKAVRRALAGKEFSTEAA